MSDEPLAFGCRNCRFAYQITPIYLLCRRNAPTYSKTERREMMWPSVQRDDWCGEHEAGEPYDLR